MRFEQWIEERGDSMVAYRLQVPRRTVASWRRRERMPRREMAYRIIDMAGGVLGLEDIYPQLVHST